MGLEQQNWPATVGIFTGVFAKEAMVGTLNSIYSQLAGEDNPNQGAQPKNSTFGGKFRQLRHYSRQFSPITQSIT